MAARTDGLRAAVGPRLSRLDEVNEGEDPFEDTGGRVQEFERRLEHFGWRDGISQPFVLDEMQTGTMPSPPPAGGGRPLGDGSWAPLTPGELFLGFPDEDGLVAVEPANTDLRDGGTYLVFRKLEQDVVGFHSFLKERRNDVDGRRRLGAQMMGRWPNGAPVVNFQIMNRRPRSATTTRSMISATRRKIRTG